MANVETIVKQFEEVNEVIESKEDRLRYIMSKAITLGYDVTSDECKKLLLSILEMKDLRPKQLGNILLKIILVATLTGSEVTFDYAKSVCADKFDVSLPEVDC